ncbi:N-acetyltransferase, partial [Amycolatopsis sp. SID8362]|nr:N-acetyltransferase [Amycolatopsis sp. SID8362]NED46124.1 N-acetyltransferase [Amycolatopsis sp. SID8362]
GPPTYRLPDGRVTEAWWFEHAAPRPVRCAGPQATWFPASLL